MFQFVSKRFETIESVDLDIFSLFQYVSVVLQLTLYTYVIQLTIILLVLPSIPPECADLITSRDG